MRRRLLFSTLVVAITAVTLFGIPLALLAAHQQVSELHSEVKTDADHIASALSPLITAGLPASNQEYLAVTRPYRDRFVLIRANGVAWPAGDARPPAGSIVGTRSLLPKVNVQVTVAASKSVETAAVTQAVVLTTALGLLAMAIAVTLGVFQAKRLTRPLTDLAAAANRLGAGDASPLEQRYGIPELDQVADGLAGSARRVSELLAAERGFASDASHQLRTPLTALSMRLEEIVDAAKYPEIVKEEAAAALQQVERLTEVVTHLIGRTRRSAAAAPESIPVDDLVAQQLIEWEPAFRRQDRRLVVSGKKSLIAYATPGALSQVVATLLDNALAHGEGTVTIRTSETPRTIVVSVRDEGKGVPDDLVERIFERHVSGRPGGTGLGLALARGIAAADGSSVVLVRPRPAVFAVFVPRGLREGETAAEPPVTGPA